MSDQIVIRTMKDDIAEMNQSPTSAVSDAPSVQKLKKGVTPPVFSLPNEVGTVPTNKYKHIVIGVLYVVLAVSVIGWGVYGYMQWGAPLITGTTTEGGEASFFELVPKDALAVVDYNIETEENRLAIAGMWNEASAGVESSGLEGDPTNILDQVDVPRIQYVLMPSNSKPFFVIKKTDISEEYVAKQREEQVLEKKGWYVFHASSIEQYSASLELGSIAEDSLLVAPSDRSDYLVRYAVSKDFLRAQFQSLAQSTVGFSTTGDVVFYLSEAPTDGAVFVSAQIAGEPPGEGVVNDTDELISLIPGDIQYAHVGLNFAEKIATLEQESSQLDTSVLTQPSVRQFMSLFSTPYAIFERKGSDGSTDIGLILALPSSLQKQIKIGDSILEQALPSLIPLIVGKRLDIQVVFNDGLYGGVPLRYVNLIGQTQTIDYAVGDNYVLISSSREGMSELVDTLQSGKRALSMQDPFKSLAEKANSILVNKAFIAGSLTDPAIRSVLPVASSTGAIPFIVSSGKTSTGIDIQAVLESK